MNERFSMLLGRYLDREADAGEIAELQTLLRQDAGLRESFWQEVEWQALFRQWGEQEWGQQAARAEVERHQPAPVPAPKSTPRPVAMPRPVTPARLPARRKVVQFPVAQWAASIAALAAAVAVFIHLQTKAPQQPATVAVATLEKAAGAEWKTENLTTGAQLKPGCYQLTKGAIILSFNRGARAVIEGPADFEVHDDNAMALASGRVRAHVPAPAHGFRVETPAFTAVDLGTEFGCDASSNGTGELHVFSGKVNWQAGSATAVPVYEHQAMRMDHGVATSVPAQPYSFLSETDLSMQELRDRGDLLGAWQIASRELDANPATVLHFDFENSGGAVRNRAPHAATSSHATVSGCGLVPGRWPGKSALAFQGANDRLEFSLPGPFQSLTLMAWVRADALHSGKNTLIAGPQRNEGEVSWYLYGDGTLGIGVLSQESWSNFHSTPVIDPKHAGSWIFLATVLDGATGNATHYFNGKPVGSRSSMVRGPVQLAVAAIGNRTRDETLHGSIDELAVLSAALTPEEISRLYQQGKPERP